MLYQSLKTVRILVTSIIHETNSFSGVPSPLARFGVSEGRGLLGAQGIDAWRGTDTEIAGFVDVLDDAGLDYDIVQPAEALPSGPVSAETFEELVSPVEKHLLARSYDAVLLALHGAMVVDGAPDSEGEILRRLKDKADVPIVASFDMHANIGPFTVEHLDALSGYHTFPHIDCAATGRRAARLLLARLQRGAALAMAFGRRPMIPHIMAQGTYRSPNKELQELCSRWEESGEVMAASVFTGFPQADIPDAGLSAAVVTDGDQARANQLVETLLDMAWERKEQFLFREEPLEASVERARRLASSNAGLIVLLDHCDNTGSGGTMDTTTVLAALLAANLDRLVFYGILDPQSVSQCVASGVGSTVTLELGGKQKADRDYARSNPLPITGRVKTISAGSFKRRGPFAANSTIHLGTTVVLEAESADIVILSKHVEPADLEYFYGLGIDPTRYRFIALKSRVHWRAGFESLNPAVVECSGTGVCVSDYSKLDYRHLRRPIYPLDELE